MLALGNNEMKKIIIGILLGFFIVFITSFIYSEIRNYLFNDKIQLKISEFASALLLRTFPNAKIKNVMVEPSKDYVNFVHDKLFKVHITYEKDSKFKKIEFNIGTYKNRFLTPPELELLMLDKDAKVLFEKET